MKPRAEPDGEVIVAGAGVSGACCALLLARLGLRVVLIDGRALPRETGEGSPASLAITPASQNILRSIDVWQKIQKTAPCPFVRIRVWDESGHGRLHFDSSEQCLPCLGHIVSTRLLLHALHEAALAQDNIKMLASAQLVSLLAERDHISVALRDGRQLQARLLVGADGADSTVRRLAGINCHNIAYRQRTLTAVVDTEREHGQVARQRFLKSGPLAFLPLTHPQRCVALWSTKPEHADYLLHTKPEHFNRELSEAFDHDAGRVRLRGDRVCQTLHRAQAERYSQNRLSLIGDAAHSVHPLAGLGANLGLLDAACLFEVLSQARRIGRDIGGMRWLRRYERWRRNENYLTMMAIEALKQMFESQNILLRWARNTGMNILDGAPSVKGLIALRAMGLSGDLPSLAKQSVQAKT